MVFPAKVAPDTTAQTLGKFAHELEDEGFDDARITTLLVVALTSELRLTELLLR